MFRMNSCLDSLLHVFVDKDNKSERKAFTQASSIAVKSYYLDYTKNIKSLGLQRDQIEGELSLILTIRLLWRLVPRRLFTQLDPDYEELASKSLKSEFSDSDSTSVEMLSHVFRMLRTARKGEWPRATLDLNRPTHRKIMENQKGRCAACLYKFPEFAQSMIDEEDITYFQRLHSPIGDEITLEKYYGKPVLDHIIPYFLGGDGEENWQILCHSCNTGKGEALSWINRKGWMPPARISDCMQLTASMRYSKLICANDPESFEEDKQKRIYLKNPDMLIHFDNLEVVYA